MQGNRIVLEKDANEERTFWYDGDGKPAVFNVYSAATGGIAANYYYMYNAQGDVIGLYDNSGNVVCRYYYDAWGKLIEITDGNGADKTYDTNFIGYKNPIRYRAYYYDNETQMYYLQSRYYNPELRRFINADGSAVLDQSYKNLQDKNLYSYCDNNPVMRADNEGKFWHVIIGAAIGGLVSGIASAVTQKITTGEVNWKSVAVATVSGAISGGFAATGLLVGAQMGINGVIGGLGYAADCVVNGQPIDLVKTGIAVVSGAVAGFVGGDGANKGKLLTNTAKSVKSVVQRETRRANQSFAQKQIASTKLYANNVYMQAGTTATAKYIAGTAVSNTACALYDFAAANTRYFNSRRFYLGY